MLENDQVNGSTLMAERGKDLSKKVPEFNKQACFWKQENTRVGATIQHQLPSLPREGAVSSEAPLAAESCTAVSQRMTYDSSSFPAILTGSLISGFSKMPDIKVSCAE